MRSTKRLQSSPVFKSRHSALRHVDQLSLDNRSHFVLLFFDRSGRVDYSETKLVDHLLITIANDALKKTKALFDVIAQSEIHSSLVVFQPRARAEYAFERHVQRHSEIERDGR